jgi:hypothetical protein
MIKSVEFVDVGPEYAAVILGSNQHNRYLNQSRVSYYAKQMSMGAWQETHQGILLGKDMRLIDGQHRLSAVVKSGVTVRMMVTYDPDIESPKGLQIDEGSQRSGAWVMGRNSRLWGTAGLLVDVATGSSRLTSRNGQRDRITTDRMCSAIERVEALLSQTNRAGFSTAPVRAAAVIAAAESKLGEAEVAEQYRRLVNDDRVGMWSSVQALDHHIMLSLIKRELTLSPVMKLIRAYRAFSPTGNRASTKITIKDNDALLLQVIETIRRLFPEPFRLTPPPLNRKN